MRETIAAFFVIVGENTIYSSGSFDLVKQIENILKKEKGRGLDIVICLDTTGSMRPHIDAVRLQLTQILREMIADFPSFRIGMVLFRDYRDEYLNKIVPFTDNFDVFQRNLNAVKVSGGGDIPEAVYEALYAGATKIPWEAESKIMILVGDAPPHPRPRSTISRQSADTELTKRGIKMYAIILPQ
jgi:Mg-chelatase subunit ChlD